MRTSDAAAFQAAAALESYEARLRAVSEWGANPGEVAHIQTELRRLCGCCLELPQLSASAVALQLAHQRFLAELFRNQGNLSDPSVNRSLKYIRDCVEALRRACRPLFVAPYLH